MGTINSSDIIFATLTQRGNQVATFRFSGLSSVADIIKHIRDSVRNCMGIVTLQLRNGSQGWTQQRSLLLS
jgi:hypothetical protein